MKLITEVRSATEYTDRFQYPTPPPIQKPELPRCLFGGRQDRWQTDKYEDLKELQAIVAIVAPTAPDAMGLGANHPMAHIVGRYEDGPYIDAYLEEIARFRRETEGRELAEPDLVESS